MQPFPFHSARLFCAGLCCLGLPATTLASEELVRNPGLQSTSSDAPPEWQVVFPAVPSACFAVRGGEDGLLFHSPITPFAVGGASQEIAGIVGGQAYAIEATASASAVKDTYRSVMVRLVWMRDGQPIHPAGMYVRGPMSEGGGNAAEPFVLKFRDVLVAPPEANRAVLKLECKWPGTPGAAWVRWQRVSVQRSAPMPPRKVKIGTVYLRPRNSTPEKNLELFCQQIDEAGRLQLDIVCLSEAITLVGTSKKGVETAEPIPGPASDVLAAAARRNRIWVVAGLYEEVAAPGLQGTSGEIVYNSAVLLNREGQLVGKYRKTHLPREEWLQGITPGSEYPVFETEFGKVAIQICYDWFFPEVHTALALHGAEIVFAPTWGTTFADKEGRVEGETVFRVRARDNGIFMVPSVYDGQSMVIDPLGRILAANGGKDGVFWAEVDLNARESLWWVGHWRGIGPRDRMPDTYQPLLQSPQGPTY